VICHHGNELHHLWTLTFPGTKKCGNFDILHTKLQTAINEMSGILNMSNFNGGHHHFGDKKTVTCI
jgi:hypothetical protein